MTTRTGAEATSAGARSGTTRTPTNHQREGTTVIVYTTCQGCGDLLHVTDNLDHHNGQPPCEPRRTKVERLTAQWLDSVIAGNNEYAEQLEAEIDQLDNRPPRLADAALIYAEWGWPVFPLKPHTKTPATRHGFKDATTDPDQIREWWQRNPQANIGLPTGHTFDVIDIDVPQGPQSYTAMLDLGIVPDAHGQVATSSGGLHLYITPSGDGNKASMAPGVDYRGAGGYVVAPPSTLGTRGRAWSWITKPSPIITGKWVKTGPLMRTPWPQPAAK